MMPGQNISLQKKFRTLKKIIAEMDCAVIAFSGGTDSTFLLKVARDILGDKVTAVIIKDPIFPDKETEEALERAKNMGISVQTAEASVLDDERFRANPSDRCYICKKKMFFHIRDIAEKLGCRWVCEGSNRDDAVDFRPGLRALKELNIRSPLNEAGLGKEEIRRLARREKLSNWNKPSKACLASRIPYTFRIDPKDLIRIEKAEELISVLGFEQVRVRHHGNIARVEVEKHKLAEAASPEKRAVIVKGLKALGYVYIVLDLEGFQSGSLNRELVDKIPKK